MHPTDQTSTVGRVAGRGQHSSSKGRNVRPGNPPNRTHAKSPMARGAPKTRTGFGVALEAEHDLRSAIPPRGHVFGHVAGVLLGIDREATGQAEVADLELAVGVDKQVARLEIAMEDVG